MLEKQTGTDENLFSAQHLKPSQGGEAPKIGQLRPLDDSSGIPGRNLKPEVGDYHPRSRRRGHAF
jgi:hypothetical protein